MSKTPVVIDELDNLCRANLYDKAAKIIRKRGVNKTGIYHDATADDIKTCKVCIYGAITVAAAGAEMLNDDPGYGHTEAPRDDIGATLRFRIGYPAGHTPSITSYNDNPATTAEDVATLLTETAERLRTA